MHAVLNIGTGLFALISAALWTIASFQKVKYVERPDARGLIPMTITEPEGGDDKIDVLRTAKRQTQWNAWAASAAAIAALLQCATAFSGAGG